MPSVRSRRAVSRVTVGRRNWAEHGFRDLVGAYTGEDAIPLKTLDAMLVEAGRAETLGHRRAGARPTLHDCFVR